MYHEIHTLYSGAHHFGSVHFGEYQWCIVGHQQCQTDCNEKIWIQNRWLPSGDPQVSWRTFSSQHQPRKSSASIRQDPSLKREGCPRQWGLLRCRCQVSLILLYLNFDRNCYLTTILGFLFSGKTGGTKMEIRTGRILARLALCHGQRIISFGYRGSRLGSL